MAHECPDCGQVCYCGGDFDDCEHNFPEDVENCTHCPAFPDEEPDYLDDDLMEEPR